MIRLVGAMIVLLAGTLIGFLQASRYAARPRQIRQLTHALQRLETEIEYGQTPLPIALSRIADVSAPPVSGFFADMAGRLSARDSATIREIWESAISRWWGRTAMKAPERDALARLGSALGASGREDQLKHVRLAMLQLQTEEAAAREEQQRYEKMSRSLGVLGAALVVIVLL